MKEYMGNIPLDEKVARQRKHIEALRAALKRADERLYKMGDYLLAQPETHELAKRLIQEGKFQPFQPAKETEDARSEETNQ